MVMSDSDDTDILLLIPPNYYLQSAEEKLIREDIETLKRRQFSSLQELDLLERQHHSKATRNLTRDFQAMDLANANEDALAMPPPPTAAYQFLPPTRKAELNNINAKLHNLEREEMGYTDNASDISSISTHTVKTQFGPSKYNREHVGMVHSTPKCMNSISYHEQQNPSGKNTHIAGESKEDCVLLEIDNFLSNDRVPPTNNTQYWDQRHSDDYIRPELHKNLPEQQQQVQTNSLPTSMHMPPEKAQTSECYHNSKGENNLISLSEIWGKSGQATAIATYSQSNLKEEQLRRHHLEKTIRQLQARLLEYQQRLSVAIEVDRTKDNALSTAQQEKKRYE